MAAAQAAAKPKLNTDYATVGAPTTAGCAYVAFGGDTPPADATTTLTDKFESLGYLGEDGVVISRQINENKIKAYGGDVVISSKTDDGLQVKITFLEVNREAVAKLIYGKDNVEKNEDGSVKKITGKPFKGAEFPFVFDELESNGYLRRTVIMRGSVSPEGDETHKDAEAIANSITITALAPKDGGAAFYVYRAKPTSAA